MIVNFSTDMRFRFNAIDQHGTTYEALLDKVQNGKGRMCMGIEFAGDALQIEVLDENSFSGVTGNNGAFLFPLAAPDGEEYQMWLLLVNTEDEAPAKIAIPAITLRYFCEIQGGLMQTGGQQRIGRLSEGR